MAIPPRAVLHEISFTNILMMGKATPDYSIDKDKEKKDEQPEWDPALDAGDPANNTNDTDRVRVTF